MAGTVTLKDSNGFPYFALAGHDDRFSIELPGGFFYTATATSPAYNSGQGCTTCLSTAS